jgi:type II secretory pathway pseudopilin PulG
MRKRVCRPGITLFGLIVVLAVLLILLGLLLPAVQKVREAATRTQSINNLKQLGVALHAYNIDHGVLPPGDDDNHFSAIARLLPDIEQDALYRSIDFTRSIDDKANAPAREARIKTLESPRDPIERVKKEYGATSYLFNHLVFYYNSRSSIPATFTDGTSNTIVTGEGLKGDGQTRAVTVRRQHVLLGKKALKGLKRDAGLKSWKTGKNIVGDRGSSWMDGRFLQTTFNGELRPNDSHPDVSCAGAGGVSSLRSYGTVVLVGLGDGNVRTVSNSISHTTWMAAITPNGGEVLGPDW